MKLYSKIILAACGASVASATLTAMAIGSVQSHLSEDGAITTNVSGGEFFTVGSALTPPTDFTHAAESTINGVVSIKNYATAPSRQSYGGRDEDFFSDPLYEFFFGSPRRQQPRSRRTPQEKPQEQARGLGSGVIVTSDGYIVTNNHVIDGADRLEVTLNDNSIYNATVVGTDPATDVALLKIDAKNLPVIPIGDSDALRVGEWVLAVGNPFGFTSTVTTGIVSAKARSVAQTVGRSMGIESYIQTDAAVNPGNSGGALVNVEGELVGINTAIYSQTGNYVGYSFAIPTSIVTKVVNDIRQYGAVQRAVVGVAYQELTPQLAKEKNITVVNDGILVGEVQDRSAALEAGIEVGDVIVALNDAPTHTSAQLQGEISKYRPGDKIKVDIIRNNERRTMELTLRNSQGDTSMTKADDFSALGCAFKELSADTRRQLGISGGVQVSGLTSDGLFRRSGIKEGFVILDINGVRITSASDVEKVYKEIMASGSSDRVMFISGIYPTGRKVYYAVDLNGTQTDN